MTTGEIKRMIRSMKKFKYYINRINPLDKKLFREINSTIVTAEIIIDYKTKGEL